METVTNPEGKLPAIYSQLPTYEEYRSELRGGDVSPELRVELDVMFGSQPSLKATPTVETLVQGVKKHLEVLEQNRQ